MCSSKLLRSILKHIFARHVNALAFVEAQVEWWCLLTLNNLAGFSVDFLEENLKTFSLSPTNRSDKLQRLSQAKAWSLP